VLLGVFAYKLSLSRQSREPLASSDTVEAPDGPLLAVSVWADGEPLPDVKVAVTGARCQERARTDDEGLVKIYGCSEGRVSISVEAPDYVRVERTIVLDDAGSLERIDLEPGERLAGRIVDDSGRPLPGITLTARVLGPSAARMPKTPWLTLTASDGSFSIETMPAGPVVLDISDGGAHEPTSVTDLALPSKAVLITLRRTAAMSGKVLGDDGIAVPDARVTLAGSGVWPARVQMTDRAGDFVFPNVPEGVYELRAEHDHDVSAPLEGVTVQPGSQAKIDLVLTPGASLRGRVRAAASGAPVRAEVRVVEEALSGHERTVQSQADGSFEVPGLRVLPHRVTLQSPGYVAEQRWLTPGTNATIELLRGAAVSGKVVDSDGRPVARADIEVKGRSVTGQAVQMVGPIQEASPLTDSSRTEVSGDNLGVTTGAVPRVPVMPGAAGSSAELGFHSDERGNFQIDGLPPGQFTLSARKPGMSAGRSQQLQLRAGATVSDVVITLPAGVSLRGRVVDARGDNVAHVRVDLVSGSDLPRSTTTRSDGSFLFESARGDCTLWARPFGAPAAKLSGNAQELTKRELLIALASNSDRLHGRVSDASGQPIEAASVRLEALKSHGYAPTVLTSADGRFDFAALPPPPYALFVEHPDYSPSPKQTIEQTRDSVEIRLQRGAMLQGRVTDAVSRLPLTAAEVVVTSAGVTRAARTVRDGSFELTHLPEGPYQLSVSAEGYVPATRDGQLSSASEDSAALRIELMHAASVSGEVVDSLGRIVWNAQVTFGATPDWSRATRSDHGGRFRLHGVPEGDHVLHARHGALQGASGAAVRVVEGEDTPGAVIRLPGVVEEEVEDEAPTARAQTQRSGPLQLAMHGARVVVEHVSAESAAARAGLEEGDVLVSVDGEPVRSAAQARGMLGRGVGRRGPRTLQVRRDQTLLELIYGSR
jgi:protocatechuate 3,4-dioxygenase beta subunit